jgi:hypothetical protein
MNYNCGFTYNKLIFLYIYTYQVPWRVIISSMKMFTHLFFVASALNSIDADCFNFFWLFENPFEIEDYQHLHLSISSPVKVKV